MAYGETMLTMNGIVCSELIRRSFDDDATVVSFMVVSTERRFDKPTGQWVDGRKFSVRVKCFRTLAENVHASLRVGDHVMVSGRLRSTEYEDGAGKRSGLELEAFAVGPNLRNATAQVRKNGVDAPPRWESAPAA